MEGYSKLNYLKKVKVRVPGFMLKDGITRIVENWLRVLWEWTLEVYTNLD